MKSKGKKFLSALLVSSMVLTSSLGFMPRTAQAIDDASVYSYSFNYIDTVTEKGNKLIVLKTDENLTGYDTTLFSVDGGAEIGNIDLDVAGNEVKIQIDGIDPEVLNYKLTIKAGGLTFSGYQQLEDIVVDFKSYEITPGFKSIFKDETTTNNVFDNNTPEEIKIFIDSDYVSSVSAKTLSGEVNWTEFEVGGTDEVDSISYEVIGISGDATRKVDTKNADGKFPAIYAGISSTKDIIITAFDAQGRELDSATVRYNFGSQFGTNFDASDVKTFNADGYTVRELLDGTTKLDDLLAGKSYGDLGKIKVFYANVDNIITVNSGNELAAVMAKLGTGNELSGKGVKIKLGADITLGTAPVLAHDSSLMIDGNNHVITGNIILGKKENNKTVKLSNATVNGNITIDVGPTADAYLTNVIVGSGFVVDVLSGGYSSIKLIGTTADTMNINNKLDKVHVIAGLGTIIKDTNIKGTKAVKMTAVNGGLFNVIELKTNKELYLIGDANSPFKILNIAPGISPNAIVRLDPNTIIEDLDVKSKVVMTGSDSSSVTRATVESSLGADAVKYDGFAIGNASGTQFAGTNIPGDSASTVKLVVPTTSNNKVILGGTAYGTHLSETALEAGSKTLTLKLEGASSDRPVNIKWLSTITENQVASLIKANDATAQSTLKDTNNFTTSLNADKSELTITWSALSLTLTNTLEISIDQTAFDKDMFETKIETDKFTAAGTSYDAGFNALYKPSFYTRAGLSDLLNKFLVYINASVDMDKLGLTVDTTNLDKMKWWKSIANEDPIDGGDITLSGTKTTMEYKTSRTAWKDASDTSTIISHADLAVGAGGYTSIFVRSKGSNDSDETFRLIPGEVWFNEDTQGSKVAIALNDTKKEIDVVNLAYDDTQYALGTNMTKRSNETPEIKAYDDGSGDSVKVLFEKTAEMNYASAGSNTEFVARPELVSAIYSDVDASGTVNASDTITFTFSKGIKTDTLDDETDLPLTSGSYGGAETFATWTDSNKVLTVALTAGANITVGTTTANPAVAVTDNTTEANTDNSADVTITGAEYGVKPTTTFAFDGANANKVMGSTTDMEFSLDNGNNWTKFTTADQELTTAQLATINDTNDIQVRTAAASPVLASAIQTIAITAAPVVPNPAIALDFATEATTAAIPTTVEWNNDNDFATTNTPGDASTLTIADGEISPGTDLFFRTRATGTTMPGAVQTLTVGARPGVTTTTINTQTGVTAGTTALMEYSIDGGTAWVGFAGNNATLTPSVLDSLTVADGFKVRLKATGSAFSGDIESDVISAATGDLPADATYAQSTGFLTAGTGADALAGGDILLSRTETSADTWSDWQLVTYTDASTDIGGTKSASGLRIQIRLIENDGEIGSTVLELTSID